MKQSIRSYLSGSAQFLLRWIVPLTVLSLPLSFKLYLSPINVELIFPAEPLIGIQFLLFGVSFLDPEFRRSIQWYRLRDPLVLVVLTWLAVSVLSTIGSTMHLVSAKAMFVRAVYVICFFLVPLCSIRYMMRDGRRLLLLYAVAMLPVVIYSLFAQYQAGFDRSGAWLASFPFFIDHTIYSAALVFAVIGSFFAWRSSGSGSAPLWQRCALGFLCAVLLLGLAFSFGRAAWVSVFVAVGYWAFLSFPRRARKWVLVGSAGVLLLVLATGLLQAAFRMNKFDSDAENAGFKEAVLSLTNVNNDTSNRERLNRWKCAVRMFMDRPILGFGPGTFQFAFVPYQRKEEMTYISPRGLVDPSRMERFWSHSEAVFVRSNPQTHYCSGGTAHSEYLLALSESGIAAFMALLVLFGSVLLRGLHAIPGAIDVERRHALLACTLGLVAYLVHAFFNNYLDDCKIAYPFWTCLAMLVSGTTSIRSTLP